MVAGRASSDKLWSWAWVLWALAGTAGVALFLVVDDDTRLVTLGQDHGPSATEAIGAVLVIAGWAGLDLVTARRWERSRWAARGRRIAVAVGVAGVVLLVPAVVVGGGWSWIPGATLLAGVQLAAAVSVRPDRSTSVTSG